MSSFLKYTDTELSLSSLIEMAGQISSLLSYVQLIDTTQTSFPRRTLSHSTENIDLAPRRADDLQRNALGRKRRAL